MSPSDSLPWTAAPGRHAGFPYAIAAGLLALEALPMSVLLWDAWLGNLIPAQGLSANAYRFWGAIVVAVLVSLGMLILGILAVDSSSQVSSRPEQWWWSFGVALLWFPVHGMVELVHGANAHLHVRLWLLVFLGIITGQMVAAASLRQAAAAIPTNRFRAAAMDCLTTWQRIRHVVLPACAPALVLLAALNFTGTVSSLLLGDALLKGAGRFTLGTGTTPENLVTAVYLFASLPMIFFALWTIRTCLRPASPRPFATR